MKKDSGNDDSRRSDVSRRDHDFAQGGAKRDRRLCVIGHGEGRCITSRRRVSISTSQSVRGVVAAL
jgi:hypothetical protein